MKTCNTCKVNKPLAEFHKNGRQGYKIHCKPCLSKIRKKYSNGRVGKLAARKAHLQARYKLTLEDWHALLISQSGRCAICNDPMKEPHIDHCHENGKVRGLLCFRCNNGLGFFKDNTEYLQQAIRYLTQPVSSW
jgi:hypothetical protein